MTPTFSHCFYSFAFRLLNGYIRLPKFLGLHKGHSQCEYPALFRVFTYFPVWSFSLRRACTSSCSAQPSPVFVQTSYQSTGEGDPVQYVTQCRCPSQPAPIVGLSTISYTIHYNSKNHAKFMNREVSVSSILASYHHTTAHNHFYSVFGI